MKAARACGILIAGGLLIASAPAAAGDDVFRHPATPAQLARDLREATDTLRGARTLSGAYVQNRTLRGVPRPLRAEGTFLFVRDLGIAWRTTVPFDSELVITPTNIIERENGRVSMRLSASQQPAVRVVSEIFASVFGLDFARLSARFDLYSRRLASGWELGLKPHAGQGGALDRIVVAGSARVTRVRLWETNGDATDIELRDTRASAAPAAAAELSRFSPG